MTNRATAAIAGGSSLRRRSSRCSSVRASATRRRTRAESEAQAASPRAPVPRVDATRRGAADPAREAGRPDGDGPRRRHGREPGRCSRASGGGELGGVIIFSNSFTSLAGLRALIASLQAAAKAGGNPPLLIATDQEGGIVKRLPDGPPTLSARDDGRAGQATAARGRARRRARYLRRLGIDVDLAPVLDVPHVGRLVPRQPLVRLRPATVARRSAPRSRPAFSPRASRRRRSTSRASAPPARTPTARRVTITSSKRRPDAAARAVPQGRAQRHEARDGLERRLSGARPVEAAGGPLAGHRHEAPARATSGSRAS